MKISVNVGDFLLMTSAVVIVGVMNLGDYYGFHISNGQRGRTASRHAHV